MKRNPEVAASLRRRELKDRSGVAAIVVAAGAGRRMGTKREKVFVTLGGKPLLFYSLKALEVSPEIERVVIVVRKESLEECREFVRRFRFKKVQAIVAGGKRRQDSVENGLRFVGESRFVLVHDGARPFLSRRLVSRTVAACKRAGAAIAALPVTDTLNRVSGGAIERTLPRENLWLVQTPQVFGKKIIEDAFRRWPRRVTATDDASMVKKSGKRVTVVEGDSFNIKVTFPGDLALAESLLRLNRRPWD
ncbi:MAG: 2-C-methyl-D-erythritol 4-phosphate cytidylyltransferase [Candidatus Eisenbacteria bacterium]|nr:2-C-methyl-D-erythritol 4-phosphate cytidylyltransferase [Candidatus Eisenbacteria bacterium]